jgi:hypothetical protein
MIYMSGKEKVETLAKKYGKTQASIRGLLTYYNKSSRLPIEKLDAFISEILDRYKFRITFKKDLCVITHKQIKFTIEDIKNKTQLIEVLNALNYALSPHNRGRSQVEVINE